ncbi:MAG: glycosyltransferase family 4 protein [Janthinobacterium lividum]
MLVIGLNYAPEPTGIAPYTTGLVEGLHEAGHQVRVIAAQPHYPSWKVAAEYEGRVVDESRAGVKVRRIRPWLPRRRGLAQRAATELLFGFHAAQSSWGRPDRVVLVSPALFSSGVAALVARSRGLHVTIWVQDIYSQGLRETGLTGPLSRAMQRVERTVLGMADSVVVIHERFADVLVARLAVPAHRVHVIRNWTHVQADGGVDRHTTRARLGWSPDDLVVLHTGAMGAKQGLENVVAASELAAANGSRVRFVLLGDGGRRAALEASAHPTARLTFLDPLPDEEYVAALWSADILLVNERRGLRETCVPSKLTSYLSTGLPVLAATDVSSITAEELLRSGAGVRVDAQCPESLLQAAEELGADPERSAALGRSGLAFRSRYLDRSVAIDAFERLLAEPAGDAGARQGNQVLSAGV